MICIKCGDNDLFVIRKLESSRRIQVERFLAKYEQYQETSQITRI
jgi:hypothetical protein